MITPLNFIAAESAAADLPLAVGPAMISPVVDEDCALCVMTLNDTDVNTMDKVLTLIDEKTTLEESYVIEVMTAMASMGATVNTPEWLHYNTAADLKFCGIGCNDARDIAYEVSCSNKKIDAIAQQTEGRRKKLLIADMESTIIENEMLDELAKDAGIHDQIADITMRAMNGEIDFETAIEERVKLLAGLNASALQNTAKRIRITEGAEQLITTMRSEGSYCALVSGGFTFYTSNIRLQLGFDFDQANELEIIDGKLTGRVIKPILGRSAKENRLRALCKQQNIPLSATMAVGDGANDLAMLAIAGLGVAFHAKPIVAKKSQTRVNHNSLTALLYLQGYKIEDFAIKDFCR